jgi:hypothetical protein
MSRRPAAKKGVSTLNTLFHTCNLLEKGKEEPNHPGGDL